jgi:hypothetical protein
MFNFLRTALASGEALVQFDLVQVQCGLNFLLSTVASVCKDDFHAIALVDAWPPMTYSQAKYFTFSSYPRVQHMALSTIPKVA